MLHRRPARGSRATPEVETLDVQVVFTVSRGPRAVEVMLWAEERANLTRWVDGSVSARAADRVPKRRCGYGFRSDY